MKISFAVTTHNEGEYIDNLLSQLVDVIETGDFADEIVILDDHSVDPETCRILESVEDLPFVTIEQRELNGDFGSHKTYLNQLCSGDYIFQIDADETVSDTLLNMLHPIIEHNPVDLIWVPRVNTVVGLTEEHIREWGWRVDSEGRVLWPDYQTRIYRNTPDILWMGKVHERIMGFNSYTHLPPDEQFALYHHKDIERQEEQNKFYTEILQNIQNDS